MRAPLLMGGSCDCLIAAGLMGSNGDLTDIEASLARASVCRCPSTGRCPHGVYARISSDCEGWVWRSVGSSRIAKRWTARTRWTVVARQDYTAARLIRGVCSESQTSCYRNRRDWGKRVLDRGGRLSDQLEIRARSQSVELRVGDQQPVLPPPGGSCLGLQGRQGRSNPDRHRQGPREDKAGCRRNPRPSRQRRRDARLEGARKDLRLVCPGQAGQRLVPRRRHEGVPPEWKGRQVRLLGGRRP